MLVPISKLTGRIDDIVNRKGDLTKRVTINSDDEIGKLSTSFNNFLNKISNMIYLF